MSLILNLETSTTVCSVSLGQDGRSIALKEIDNGYTHAENLTLFIQDVLEQAGIELEKIDAIAVSKGPGSFTGLRIGVSVAKGLCYALDKPLIAVDTLKAFTSMQVKESGQSFFCPMLDARRMEVYCAVYDKDLNEIRPVSAEIITENSFRDLLNKSKVLFFGNGSQKCRNLINHSNAIFIEDVVPSAAGMCSLSEELFLNKEFENTAYFEPCYLKDFLRITPIL